MGRGQRLFSSGRTMDIIFGGYQFSWVNALESGNPLTFTFANGAVGAALTQDQNVHFEGELLNILQINSDNTGNRTAQIIILDVDGNTIFDGTANNENASYNHEFGVTIRRILWGKNTVRCVISGDPGTSGYDVKAILSLTGIDG